MSLYFTVQITGGTSTGPYNIYYDVINNGSIATKYPSNLPATGITLSQLNSGVDVKVPDTANQIILYNNGPCKTYQTFEIPNQPKEYPKLCFEVYLEKDFYTFTLEYQNIDYNGKPQYTDGTITVQWNNVQNYWEMIGYPTTVSGTFISTTLSDIPDTNWTLIGGSATQQVVVYQGNCPVFYGKGGFTTQLLIEKENPTCVGDTDGSIFVTPYYPSTWSFSLDGLIYSNYTGIFTNLSEGSYTVYAKDSSGTVISDSVTLVGDPVTFITIPYTTSLQPVSTVGNMNYYNFKVIYNTTLIPVGENVTFDFKFIYGLIYNQPGTVLFDTDNSTVLLNGLNQPINHTSSSPFSISGPLPCNPTFYNQLVGSEEYSVTSLTLVNGDTFEANIVYGIDTQTAGANLNGCITQGIVNINASFENVSITCNCCNLNVNQINLVGTPQIYIF